MQAVILTAGAGTRLRPLTNETPKPLIKVNDIPILQRTLNSLPENIDELIFVVGYQGGKIKEFVNQVWNKTPVNFVEQKKLLGTGDAIYQARPLLKRNFLVLNGDDLYKKEDLEKLTTKNLALLACQLETPIVSGKLVCDKKGCLVAIEERSETTLVNCGCYLLNQNFFNYPLVKLPDKEEYGLPQTLAVMINDHVIDIVRANFWMPVGTHKELTAANKYFLNND